jgi:hypothetical protein
MLSRAMNIPLVVSGLVAAASVIACSPGSASSSAVAPVHHLEIRYESPGLSATLRDTALEFVKKTYSYPHPAATTPSEVKQTRGAVTLSATQLENLRSVMTNSGFMKLKPAYGAPEEERHYPYMLEVTLDGESRSVVYRSNPSYLPAPQAFSQVQQAVEALAP